MCMYICTYIYVYMPEVVARRCFTKKTFLKTTQTSQENNTVKIILFLILLKVSNPSGLRLY